MNVIVGLDEWDIVKLNCPLRDANGSKSCDEPRSIVRFVECAKQLIVIGRSCPTNCVETAVCCVARVTTAGGVERGAKGTEPRGGGIWEGFSACLNAQGPSQLKLSNDTKSSISNEPREDLRS